MAADRLALVSLSRLRLPPFCRLLEAQGDKDEAIAAFKKYLEMGKDPALREKAQAELKELSAK